jgi:hypothetical protein
MAQGREDPAGYDWEDAVPSEPESFALPAREGPESDDGFAIFDDLATPEDPGSPADATAPARAGALDDAAPYGAPTFSYALPDAPAERGPRRGVLPAWAIVAIVAVQAAALVVVVTLVLGGLQRLGGGDPAAPVAEPATGQADPSDPPEQNSPERDPGTVTDSAGREVTDGTGRYEEPATVGEHTVSWRAWTDGTLGVSALEVDLAATLPGAEGQDVVQDGYRLVLVTYEVRYDGPGQLAPAEELWLTGESDRTYFPDIAQGMVPAPMKQVGPLGDGEAARFQSAFLVPESEIDSFRLGVETFTGETLYFAAS